MTFNPVMLHDGRFHELAELVTPGFPLVDREDLREWEMGIGERRLPEGRQS